MGSSLAVVVRKEDRIVVSFDGRGDTLQGRLAFGPGAFWRSFIEPIEDEDKKYWIEARAGKVIRGEPWSDGNIPSFARAIHQREGFAYVDYEDKVLYYKTGCDWEWEPEWGTWFAAWLSYFWHDWRVYRSSKKFDRTTDLLNSLGIALPEEESKYDHSDWLSKPIEGTLVPKGYEKYSLNFLVKKDSQIFDCHYFGGYLRDILLLGLDNVVVDALNYGAPFNTEKYGNPFDSANPQHFEFLIDANTKTVWIEETSDWMEDNAIKSLSPSWVFKEDAQGIYIWFQKIGLEPNIPLPSKDWIHQATKPFEALSTEELIAAALELSVIKNVYELLPDKKWPWTPGKRRTMMWNAEDGQEVRRYWSDLNNASQYTFRRQLLYRMTNMFVAQDNLKRQLMMDRSLPNTIPHSICPYNWQPKISNLLWEDQLPLNAS